ncbi:hypothetical protein IQ06DRAFT_306957 [Phaeosphaeriaceae sp. SRC1lsM3a]|nr:hypothetical protein IQ06DRAFT_306957 [Stagonospora sp. SRC1lsM3a]
MHTCGERRRLFWPPLPQPSQRAARISSGAVAQGLPPHASTTVPLLPTSTSAPSIARAQGIRLSCRRAEGTPFPARPYLIAQQVPDNPAPSPLSSARLHWLSHGDHTHRLGFAAFSARGSRQQQWCTSPPESNLHPESVPSNHCSRCAHRDARRPGRSPRALLDPALLSGLQKLGRRAPDPDRLSCMSSSPWIISEHQNGC